MMNDEQKNLLLELDAITSTYYDYVTVLLIIHILTIGYLLQDCQEMLYARLRGIYTKVISLSLILNVVSTVLVIYWLYKYFYDFTANLDDVNEKRRVKEIIDRIRNATDFSLEIFVAALTGIQFTRIIFALQMSRVFGPMVKILGNMLIDLLIFILLYALIFLIFTCAAQLLFHDLDSYDSFFKAAVTLYSASLGNFDYTAFEDQDTFTYYVGHIYLTIYLVVSMITLLNFLIAILSNTYALLTEQKNALYLKEVILLRMRYKYNKKYSAIVSALVPLNALMMVFNPLLILFKSQMLNQI